MKIKWIPALIVLILAIVATVGSQTFLGACVHEDGSFGACHWAARAVMGEGALLAVLAALALMLRRERAGLYLAMLPVSILGAFTPGGLISICTSPAMRCRMAMRPAMMILFFLMLAASLTGWLMSRGEAR